MSLTLLSLFSICKIVFQYSKMYSKFGVDQYKIKNKLYLFKSFLKTVPVLSLIYNHAFKVIQTFYTKASDLEAFGYGSHAITVLKPARLR